MPLLFLFFGAPNSPLAQSKNVIVGHFIAAFIGVAFVQFIGVSAFSMAIASGLGLSIMMLTKTTHPPAGATLLLIMLNGENWSFLFIPVLTGSLVLVTLVLHLSANNDTNFKLCSSALIYKLRSCYGD